MIRLIMASLIVVLMLSGCTFKEFSSGVEDATDGVGRVIRGTNN